MTFVRTRLALDALAKGHLLRVTLKGEEPLRNVTHSAQALGHTVLTTENGPDDRHTLTIRKN